MQQQKGFAYFPPAPFVSPPPARLARCIGSEGGLTVRAGIEQAAEVPG